MTFVRQLCLLFAAAGILICAHPASGAASSSAAGKLSAAERKVVAASAAEVSRAIELMATLVNINSGTFNLEGVAQVGQIMRRELDDLGFETRWIPMQEIGRSGHLVAQRKGKGRGKRMLLIGHLDTVFEKDSPFQKFERKGDTAAGPGVNDMKDGLAIMVAALRAMRTAGTLERAQIIIVLSGDEERPGKPIDVARRDMREAATRSDVALEFESLATKEGRDVGSISRRSSSGWALQVSAKSGHSSGVFSEDAGYGAAYEMARILDAFREELREPSATFNAGLVVSGATASIDASGASGGMTGKTNIIPATALVRGDLRTIDNEQTKRIRQRMSEIVARSPLAGTRATIEFDESYPAMPPTEGNRKLLAMLNRVNAKLGLEQMGELDPLERGAGDIAFVADKLDGLIGFGAAGKGGHSPEETVDLTSFDRQIKRAALLMTALSQ